MIGLRSELRRRVLGFYFASPDAAPHLQELARLLALDPGNLSREMARLESLHLVVGRRRGNRKHYRLNRTSRLARRWKLALARSDAAIPRLEKALRRLPGVEFACVYGPCVRRLGDPVARLDVMIVGRSTRARVEAALGRVQRRLGRKIHCVVLSQAEFESRRRQRRPTLADFRWKPRITLVPGKSPPRTRTG